MDLAGQSSWLEQVCITDASFHPAIGFVWTLRSREPPKSAPTPDYTQTKSLYLMHQFLINSKLLEKQEPLKLYSSARSSKIAYVAPLACKLGVQPTHCLEMCRKGCRLCPLGQHCSGLWTAEGACCFSCSHPDHMHVIARVYPPCSLVTASLAHTLNMRTSRLECIGPVTA